MNIFFLLPFIPLIGGILTLVNYFRHQKTNLLTNVFSGLLLGFAILAVARYSVPVNIKIPYYQGTYFTHNLQFELEGLSLFMVLLVSSISFFVHHYASRYLSSDSMQGRFMGQLSLLTSAVIFLVMSGNLLTCFFSWEFVGLSLYLLLNHYHYDPRANRAAKKQFIINRVGDICFLVAVCLCYAYFHSSNFMVLASTPLALISFNNWHLSLQSLIVLLIFIAIMTKSAQFPFHIWLPDTMQAPTPVSAMMHAGIINVGGFLLARISLYLPIGSLLSNIIYTVGMISVLLAAFFALTQNDVKRQLAYSTMGQMGYMIVQTGLGFFTAAVFHLAAHGFFKAYLFLSAGSTIGHKYEQQHHSLRQGTAAIWVFLLTMLVYVLYNWTLYHSLTSSVIILGMFISLAIGQYMSELTVLRVSRVQKVLIYCISLIFLLIYVFLIHGVDLLLHNSVDDQLNHNSWYKLSLALLILLIQLAVWLKPLWNSNWSARFNLRCYYLSVNKLFIEEGYRCFIINPYTAFSQRLNRCLSFKVLRLPILALLLALVSFFLLGLGLAQASTGYHDLNLILIIICLVLALIAAYCAVSLELINYYLFLAQIDLASLGLVSLSSGLMHYLALNQLINMLLIFSAIGYITRRQTRARPLAARHANKLIWSSFYYCILMFLWIGFPFTASFNIQLLVIYDLLVLNWGLALIVALSLVFLAMAILNALQEYVFNPASCFLQTESSISLSGHIFLISCIVFNICNGLRPGWLIAKLTLLNGHF